MPAALPFFRLANYFEAGFWVVLGIGFAVAAIRARRRGRCALLAIALVLFGLSDVVEASTGAWYRPWWLLTWKGLCLLVLLLLVGAWLWEHRRRSIAAPPAGGFAAAEEAQVDQHREDDEDEVDARH